ncbi:hypothetical protein LXL04_024008 [Taraxacum kok-saghyz]
MTQASQQNQVTNSAIETDCRGVEMISEVEQVGRDMEQLDQIVEHDLVPSYHDFDVEFIYEGGVEDQEGVGKCNWGIVDKLVDEETDEESVDGLGEDSEIVINTDDYEFASFQKDERKRKLKELSSSRKCSHGEVHKKAFRVGQSFKIIVDLVQSRRRLYLAKNDEIRIRFKCNGVVDQSKESSGGPSTRSKMKCDGKNNNKECKISRSAEEEDLMVKIVTMNINACRPG